MFRIAVLDRGPTRCDKSGIDVNPGTALAIFAGKRGRHIMNGERYVIFGLIAVIAILVVAYAAEKLLF